MVRASSLATENQENVYQDDKIKDVLDVISQEMSNLGYSVDLNLVPVIVLNVEEGGQCFRRKDKSFIRASSNSDKGGSCRKCNRSCCGVCF